MANGDLGYDMLDDISYDGNISYIMYVYVYIYIYIYTYMDILAMMGILYTYTGIIGYKGNIMGILLRETEWMEYTSVYHTPHMFPLCPWPKPSTGPTGVWSSGRRAAGAVLDDVASDAEHRGGELTADGCDMTS